MMAVVMEVMVLVIAIVVIVGNMVFIMVVQ